jgi:hypothetical protein
MDQRWPKPKLDTNSECEIALQNLKVPTMKVSPSNIQYTTKMIKEKLNNSHLKIEEKYTTKIRKQHPN